MAGGCARTVGRRRRVLRPCRAWVGHARLQGGGALPAETDPATSPHQARATAGKRPEPPPAPTIVRCPVHSGDRRRVRFPGITVRYADGRVVPPHRNEANPSTK